MLRQAPLILALAALTSLVSLLILLGGGDLAATTMMGFIPARLSGLLTLPAAVPALLTPLSATLVHGSALHLITNMLMLVWAGVAVERVFGWSGAAVLYLVGAYLAAAAQWIVAPESTIPMIGASGAISALVGAYSLSFGEKRQFVASARFNRWLNALWLMLSWIIIQLMVAYLAEEQGMLLATPAHVGGFLAGLLLQRPLLLWRYRHA